MSTTTTNQAIDYAVPGDRQIASPLTAPDRADGPLPLGDEGALFWGLPAVVWIKIGVVAVLMAALFRFNLARLWGKTNPFTGQSDNWQHTMLLPLIGLYYLYVWRDDLLGSKPAVAAAPARKAESWTLVNLWGLAVGMGAAAVGVACATAPDLLLGTAASVVGLPVPWAAVAVGVWTVASGAFIWGRRHTLGGPFLDRALDGVSRLLWTWLMLALVAWGLGFFVWVGSVRAFALTRLALGALSLAGLIGVVTLRGSERVQSVSRQLNAASAGWFGGFVMLFGILFSFWGIWPGQNDFFKDIGMVIALFGVTTLLAGWRVMRVAWFPIVFLLCGVPWPDQYYSKLALPLQYLAAKVAVYVLNMTGVLASQQGTKMVMAGFGNTFRTLNVAEACAGLKSLMTFISVAAALAFLSARPLWQKAVITASAVPIAIACNVMRVTGQGLLDFYVSQKWSQGFAHGFAGLVMLIPGFFLILLVLWILDHLFIDVVDDGDRLKQASAKRARAVAIGTTAGAGPASAKPVTTTAKPAVKAAPAQAIPAQTAAARAAAAARPAAAAGPTATPARGDQPAVIQIPRKPAAAATANPPATRPAAAGNAVHAPPRAATAAGASAAPASARPTVPTVRPTGAAGAVAAQPARQAASSVKAPAAAAAAAPPQKPKTASGPQALIAGWETGAEAAQQKPKAHVSPQVPAAPRQPPAKPTTTTTTPPVTEERS